MMLQVIARVTARESAVTFNGEPSINITVKGDCNEELRTAVREQFLDYTIENCYDSPMAYADLDDFLSAIGRLSTATPVRTVEGGILKATFKLSIVKE